jgi:hypothetical protein
VFSPSTALPGVQVLSPGIISTSHASKLPEKPRLERADAFLLLDWRRDIPMRFFDNEKD